MKKFEYEAKRGNIYGIWHRWRMVVRVEAAD
jgi:hypothetical protein